MLIKSSQSVHKGILQFLVRTERSLIIMKNTIKRAIISVVIFAVIYILSGPIIGWHNYDMYLKAIEFLAAVIGAGCYWIGSNER